MGVHSEMIVLLYPVLYSDGFVPIKSMKRGPGPFTLLPSFALRETYRGKEKSDVKRKQHRQRVKDEIQLVFKCFKVEKIYFIISVSNETVGI